jgi:nicotinamidase-related amidase
MQSKLAIGLLALALVAMLLKGFTGCESNNSSKDTPSVAPSTPAPFPEAAVPTFNEDSAFTFIQKQVAFGPRVPNTSAHKKCATWLSNEFKRYGLSVIEQKFTAKHFKGEIFNCTNIEYVLRNLGIEYLIIYGVCTDQCVECAIRDAADRGFMVTQVEDACAADEERRHDVSIEQMKGHYCRTRTTDEVIAEIEALSGC